ncbi:MAG TPA: hypothetical protein VFS07_01180 [Gemmatimonadales bacterium]|nr:hypothetical protein [Gemmatimonadales bacterium]
MRWSRTAAALAAALLLATSTLAAQVPADSALRRQQRTTDSLAAALRALQARIDSLLAARAAGDTGGGDELAALRAAASAAADSGAAQRAQPQAARLGQNALNPEISVTGDFRANAVHPGPQRDNFVAREFEFGFQSALDPYSTAKLTLAVEDGEASIEEGYAYFTALPAHLRLDLGQFRQQVGELNRWHLHALPEDEYPLVVRRFGGEEGLVAPGVSLYWPLPFSGAAGTYELTVQATTGANDVLFTGARRPALNAQLSGFWQFSRSTYAQVSVSGLHGTAPDTGLTTDLGVVAARFSWRPPGQAQARDLTLRSELWALRRKFDLAGPAFFDKTRLGGYADATWKLDRRWVVGVRGDYVQSPEPGPEAHEWAVTPSLTFWQSEFVFLRGVFEHARDITGADHDRLSLQVVYAMGPHKHELF